MFAISLFVAFLLAPSSATVEDSAFLRDSEVWLKTGGAERQLTRDGVAKDSLILSPERDRIAYLQLSSQGPTQVVILTLDGKVEQSFTVRSPDAPHEVCASVSRVAWGQAGRIWAECHVNPSFGEFVELDGKTGAPLRSVHGLWFALGPNGEAVAHIAWFAHFAPPWAQSQSISINDHVVYPLPAGTSPVLRKPGEAAPYVVAFHSRLSNPIHEVQSNLAWSPDGQRVAAIDCSYTWQAASLNPGTENEGTRLNRSCALVAVRSDGSLVRVPIRSVVSDQARPTLEWTDATQVRMRAGGKSETFHIPQHSEVAATRSR